MAKRITKTVEKIKPKKIEDEKQENGIQEGGKEGNEDVTESLQSKGEQRRRKVELENEEKLLTIPFKKSAVEESTVEMPVAEESIVESKPETTLDWVAIGIRKAKEEKLRRS